MLFLILQATFAWPWLQNVADLTSCKALTAMIFLDILMLGYFCVGPDAYAQMLTAFESWLTHLMTMW